MNAFATYGEASAPRERKQKEPSALDLKMREKQRLHRSYKAALRKDRQEAFSTEPRLRDFMRWLRRQDDPRELVEGVAESWLPSSTQNVRILALRLIDRHCNRLNRLAGFEALDDPLPPESNVFFRCRDLLHAGGRA